MSKRKGSRNERKAMRLLESTGYYVTRAAASLGMFDIVAINRQGIRLIQVKSNRNASPMHREQIALFDGLPDNATKEIWRWKDYARAPLIDVIKTISRGDPPADPDEEEEEEPEEEDDEDKDLDIEVEQKMPPCFR